MFDSPIADKVPGKIAYMGFPYHGLLLFPGLQDSTACPIKDVRLQTHGGLDVLPFSGISKTVTRYPVAHCTRLFADPRALDAPEDPATGENLSGYIVMSDQAEWAGTAGLPISFPYSSVYHDGSSNHLIKSVGNVMRIMAMAELSRDGSLRLSDDHSVSVPISLGTAVDSSADGATILSYRFDWNNPSSLRLIRLSGAWPDVQGSQVTLVTADQADNEQLQLVGTEPSDVGYWRFGATAYCSLDEDNPGCHVLITDQPSQSGSQAAFTPPWGYVYTNTRDKLLTAWLDDGQAEQLWFEVFYEREEAHNIEWGVDSVIENDERARAELHINTHDISASVRRWAITHGETTISEIAIERRHEFVQNVQKIVEALASGGNGDSGEESYSDVPVHSLTFMIDGVDIFARFPEITNPDQSGSSDFFNINGAIMFLGDAEQGERKALHVYIRPLEYSRNLYAIQCQCVYEHKIDSETVEIKSEIIVGHGFARGVIDSGVSFHPGSISATLYGSSCPKTKKIARNYPYPVTWI